MIDAAEQALRDGLKDTDKTRRLHAAVTLLTLSPAARKRGWEGAGHRMTSSAEPPAVTMRWLNAPEPN